MSKAQIIVAQLLFFSVAGFAQNKFLAGWLDRIDKVESEQPYWASPLVTTTPRLTERLRYDQLWQTNSKGVTTNNFDGGKGLNLILFDRLETNFYLPPYLEHNNSAVKSGFGDIAFLFKYRMLTSPQSEGGYILTAFLG